MNTILPKKKKFIDVLKEVKDFNELNSILADIKIPYTKGKGNRFDDDSWLVLRAKDEYQEINFSSHLEPFPMAICKLYYLLKTYGYLGLKPKSPMQFINILRPTIKELCATQPGIKTLTILQEKDISLFIHNNREGNPETTYRKLAPFKEAANLVSMLPGFLRISKTIFSSSDYNELRDAARERTRKNRNLGGSTRPPYPFEDLATIMPVAFEFIEHGCGILDLTECLYKVDFFNPSLHDYHRYRLAYNVIKEFNKNTGDKILDSIIKEVKTSKSSRLYDEKGTNIGYSIKKLYRKINSRIHLAESACAIVVLVLSAMRRGELAKLSRKLEIDGDDDFRLHKVIFKTSASLNGEKHIIPMPEIGVKALSFLSRLASIRDNKEEGNIITLHQYTLSDANESDAHLGNRLSKIVNILPESLNLTPLSPHQLRHVMAYLVMHVVGKEGLEVVRYLLGHTSILMTLTYLSRINPFFREVLEDISKKMSKEGLEALYLNIQKGKKVYGVKAAQINGIISDDMIDIMFEYWENKIENGWMMILLTPMAMCMHDPNTPGEMKCQRGLDNSDLVGIMPVPSRCDPNGCSSALFLEEHIIKVMSMTKDASKELENNEIFKRLGENLYFNPDDFLSLEESRYKSIIDEYIEDQSKVI